MCLKEHGFKKFRMAFFVFVLSPLLPYSSYRPAVIPVLARQPRNFGNYAELSFLKFITRLDTLVIQGAFATNDQVEDA